MLYTQQKELLIAIAKTIVKIKKVLNKIDFDEDLQMYEMSLYDGLDTALHDSGILTLQSDEDIRNDEEDRIIELGSAKLEMLYWDSQKI